MNIISVICMLLLCAILACCLYAMHMLTKPDNLLSDKEFEEMCEYFKKENNEK